MSGGRWDYCGSRIQSSLETIGSDSDVKIRWPKLAELLKCLGEVLASCEHDMDWDLESDSAIPDDRTWENQQIGMILEAAMKVAPDFWFPRGKWATIQAIQERIEP